MTRAVAKSQTVHHLMVEATDGGGLKSRANAEVELSVIDTRQQPPIFEQSRYLYSVREDVPRGTLVGAVRATSRQKGELPGERNERREEMDRARGGLGKTAGWREERAARDGQGQGRAA